ncbi:MAG: ATP-binding protein, partial [Dehalococcoidia bacterium]
MSERSRLERDMIILRRAIVLQQSRKSNRPILVILVGLPGSGKSYFAARFINQIPATILESDFIRKTLLKKPTYSRHEHARVFRAIYAVAKELLDAKFNVIIDATNLNEKYRRPLHRIAEEIGANAVTVYLKTPRDVARERLIDRKLRGASISDADWSVYEMLEADFEPVREPFYE